MSERKMLAPHVESDPERCGGEPVVVGRSIPTIAVYSSWKHGGEQSVAEDYPGLEPEQIRCAAAFQAGRQHERAHPSNHDELMIAIAAALSDFNYIDNDATERILEFALDVAREQE